MKVRLYRGPMDGKVMYISDRDAYKNEIMVAGTKPLTRKQRYDLFTSNQYSPFMSGPPINHFRARYVLRRMMQPDGVGGSVVCVPMHPDGSVYYEWDKPRNSKP